MAESENVSGMALFANENNSQLLTAWAEVKRRSAAPPHAPRIFAERKCGVGSGDAASESGGRDAVNGSEVRRAGRKVGQRGVQIGLVHVATQRDGDGADGVIGGGVVAHADRLHLAGHREVVGERKDGE